MLQESRSYVTRQQSTRRRKNALATGPVTQPGSGELAGCRTSDGYRRALEADQAAAPARRVDPAIAEAVERQDRAMRELSRKAFPETEAVPEDARAPIEDTRA
jgi:hypothetical protein